MKAIKSVHNLFTFVFDLRAKIKFAVFSKLCNGSKLYYLCAAFMAATMKIIKKLDIYILKQFCLLFAGTFFICLFIFMMQFLWRYVEDLIGKGLSYVVLGKFFFYAAMTLVPMSLPLALLLASLITFGNMGERLELLAMKAAGIPLVRILRPVLLFVCSWLPARSISRTS